MFSDLLVLLKRYASNVASRILALFKDTTMSKKDDDIYEETQGPGKPPKPGSVDPKAPLDKELYEESSTDTKPPKPGTTNSGGKTDTKFDGPE